MSHVVDCTSKMQDNESWPGAAAPYAPRMVSTHLTRRRAVDNCRMRSSLCRSS
jgi:predicted RNA polymerase sigma factor